RPGRGSETTRASSRSDLDDAPLERVAHEVGACREPELVQDVAPVGLDRADAEEELSGDLLIRVPECDQPEDLTLALGQVVLRLAHDEARGERRVHVDPVAEDRVDRIGELLVRRILDDVPLGAELEGLARVGGLVLHREDHHPCPRRAQLGDRIEPRPVAQREIENDDVGPQQSGALERLGHPGGLADDLDPARRLEHLPHAAAHDLVIVDEQGPDHEGPICISKRTRAPPPAGCSRSTLPATIRARSSMPSMPWPMLPGLKPLPSSSIVTTSWSPRIAAVTPTLRASAWRTTLPSASCTMR